MEILNKVHKRLKDNLCENFETMNIYDKRILIEKYIDEIVISSFKKEVVSILLKKIIIIPICFSD